MFAYAMQAIPVGCAAFDGRVGAPEGRAADAVAQMSAVAAGLIGGMCEWGAHASNPMGGQAR